MALRGQTNSSPPPPFRTHSNTSPGTGISSLLHEAAEEESADTGKTSQYPKDRHLLNIHLNAAAFHTADSR